MNFEQEYFYINRNDDNNTEPYATIDNSTIMGGSLTQVDKNNVKLVLTKLGEGKTEWEEPRASHRTLTYKIFVFNKGANPEWSSEEHADQTDANGYTTVPLDLETKDKYTRTFNLSGTTAATDVTTKVKIDATITYDKDQGNSQKKVTFKDTIDDFDHVAPTGYTIQSFSISTDGNKASFNLQGIASSSGELKMKWIITDKKGEKVEQEGTDGEIIKPTNNTASKAGINIEKLVAGPLKLKVRVIDAMKNEGKWTEDAMKNKEIEDKDVQTGILGFKLFKLRGLIPGQLEGGKQNFKIITALWVFTLLIVCILGADFSLLYKWSPIWGWITNTIAVYRLTLWNVIITFILLFWGFLGYLYWLGKCSTYDAADIEKQKKVDKDTAAFFKPFLLKPNIISIVTMIAGFLMASLPMILVAGAYWKPGGSWRDHIPLLIFGCVCIFIIGAGFVPKYIQFRNCEKIYEKEGKRDAFVVTPVELITFCLFFFGSSLSGSFLVHYFIRTLISILGYNSAAQLPKFAQGLTGLAMSLFTMGRNLIYSLFIIIANIFGGLSFFTSN